VFDAPDRADLRRLHERLWEARTAGVRLRLLGEWLAGRMALGVERSALVPASLRLLRQAGGRLSIPELARQLAVSQRHLERLYRSQVGMSPKQYARLRRVAAARRALKQSRALPSAGLAVDLGYYDQAHLIRDFSAVVGMTPEVYRRRGSSPAPPATSR
jgi:transcriptional regulator GlxA family with amidase domain